MAFFALNQPFFWGVWINQNRQLSKISNPNPLPITICWLVFLSFWGSFTPNPTNYFPQEAIAYMKKRNLSGNLSTPFNWGQYCIFHLYPRMKVSMDGRYDTVYPERVFKDFIKNVYGIEGRWKHVLRKYDTNYLLVRDGSDLARIALESNLKKLYNGSNSLLFKIEGKR
jgi:hypothetical protein